jgi:PAS domain S-box-containing protein
VREQIVEQFRHGPRAHGVLPARRLDGELRTFQVSASTYTLDGEVFSLGASMDITDRLRLQEERAKAQKQYQELFTGVRDVVFSLSTEGVITVLNPAFEGVTGLPTSDWIGRQFLDLVHPDDTARAMGNLQSTLAGKPKDDQPIRIRTADGYRHAEIFSAPRLEDGRVVGVLGIGRDVSERMSLEDQLRQSQKMEAMGSLAGGIAHDFNNLLTVIIGFGQLTLASSTHKALTEDVTEIVNAAERAAEMTRQLLAFSRKQVREPRDVNVNKVLDGVEKMLRRMIGEHVVLRSERAERLGIIRADPGQLEQVVANLAVNARDAMPGGGTVTISTANVMIDELFAAGHEGAVPGEYVRLRVADTGTGMTPETRRRIFEPFFTTKEVGKGTGLGLSTVFGIVHQSGGFVVVDSAPGQGTTFDVHFPCVEPRGDAAVAVGGARAENRGTETILIAEDNPQLRALTARMLTERDYIVLSAGTGDEALEIADRHAGEIDLLITDVVMPGMSGRSLAQAIRHARPGIRVLYVSGYSDDMLGQQGVLDPDIHLLAKPFTPETLADRVREVLDRQPA